MKTLIATMLLLYAGAAWAAGPPDAETWARFGKVAEANRLNTRGIGLYRQGKVGEATEVFIRVLEMREGLYPKARHPQGHPDLAQSLNNLALLYASQADYAKAESLYRRALEMYEGLYPRARHPQGHPDLARSLNNLALLHEAQGDYAKAEALLRRALEMNEALYPRARYPKGHPDLARSLNDLASMYQVQAGYAKAEPLLRRALEMEEALYPRARYPQGHPNLALSLNNLAFLYQSQADYAKAEPLLRRALEMREGLYPRARHPQGHPHVALSLNDLASLYKAQGDYAKAEPLYRRALEICEGLYPRARNPQGHPVLARSLNDLASMHYAQGDYARAEPLYRRALEMYERLYPTASHPRGHPDLMSSLNNLALLHKTQADYAKAEPLLRRALEMNEALYPRARYPQGHPQLALSLNNLSSLYQVQGDYAKAEPLSRRALDMNEGLYPRARHPQGHPDLARSLNQMGFLHKTQGDYAKAEPLYRRALEMREGLYPRARYPQGHPDLASSLDNLAALNEAKGDYAKAEPLYRRALTMYRDSATSLAATSEATSLNYAASAPPTRDGYLSTTLHLPEADVYPAVWETKAAIARVAEGRHLAVLAASSKAARDLWEAVLSLKRERERLLLTTVVASKVKDRNDRLVEIEEEIRKKEAALRPLLPAMKRFDELSKATPADLRKALPADAAFVDLLRYWRTEQEPKTKRKKGKRLTACYVAFVVTRSAITRVELGEAGPIEEALDFWRRAITEGGDGHAKYAGVLRGLVWAPLAKHLPAATKVVYLCPDADLSRLPWAALPGKTPGTILLEDYALAVVPHGPFLLDQLTARREKPPAKPAVLAMGGVSYDKQPARETGVESLRSPAEGKGLWPALKGTAAEVASLEKMLAGRKLVTLSGDKASIAALLAELPRADHAHLATHGYFADKKFRSVLQLDEKLFGRLGTERSSAGSRSPMILSGLVCAGANLKGTPNRGIVTADAIVGLDLRRLDLAVLSACETGLGDVAGGEGVFGLQRAFHVAGTRNVVASLWKVDDEATAALMALFYRNLWEHDLGPAEAMRQAQLAVYRGPKHIKEWAAGRGPLAKPVAGPKAKPPAKGAEVASPKVYAAFVVSGVAR